MAKRQFSHPLRISAIASNYFTTFFKQIIVVCLLLLLSRPQFADSKRIDDGGVIVPLRIHPEDFTASPLLDQNQNHNQDLDSQDTTLPHHSNPFLTLHHEGGQGQAQGQGQGQGQGHRQDQSEPHLPNRIVAIRNRPFRLKCPIRIESGVRILGLWWLKDELRMNLNQLAPNSNFEQQGAGGGRVRLVGKDLFFEKIVHKIGSSNQNQNSGRGGGGGGGSSSTNNNAAVGTGSPVTVGRHRNYSDEGTYRCVLKSANGVVLSPPINLAVAGLEVQEAQSQVSGKVREWLLLRCPVRSTPKASIVWTKEVLGESSNVTLSQELFNSRYKTLSSGTLLITNAQLNDSGSYRCTARNEVLRNRERKAEVLLTIGPSEEQQEQDQLQTPLTTNSAISASKAPVFLPTFEATHVVLEEDEDFALDCIAYGVPLPSITWVFTFLYENETAAIPVSTIISDGKEGHDTLYLSPFNSTLTANYTCVVSNGVGLPITKTMQVSRFPILLKTLESQQYPPAKTVRFECRVPSPFYLLWYKDGQLLETGKGRVKTRGNELVISNTIRNDSGFYQCEVLADEFVYSIGTARLLVESGREQPDAPVDLQCKVESSRMISVTWKSPVKADVKAYTIHYTAADGEERQQVTKNTTFLLDVLKPHTNYSIYVRSYSGYSASAQSNRIHCITREDVPISYPSPLQFERVGPATQARVCWRPLSNENARGRITLYKIQWRPTDGSFINVRYLDGDFNEFLITDLMVNQSYEMRVIPATSVGYPLEKDLIPWTPIPPRPPTPRPHPHQPPAPVVPIGSGESTGGGSPAPSGGENSTNNTVVVVSSEGEIYSPPQVHLSVVNATAVHVAWTEPSAGRSRVTPKGFRLTYATYLARIDDLVTFGPFHIFGYETREYLFTDFAPGTSYEVSVQTFGEGWESDVATKSIRTFSSQQQAPDTAGGEVPEGTVQDVPIIYNLKAYPLSSTEIRLTWDSPFVDEEDGAGGLYRIKYNRVDSNDFHYRTSNVSHGTESIDIKDLSPFTAYEFVVRFDYPETETEGPFSQKVESRTLAGKPGPPAGVDWKVTNNRTIQLSWLAPLEPNGLIQQYWVEYKNKTNGNQEFQTQSITVANGSSSSQSSYPTVQQQQQSDLFSGSFGSGGVTDWTLAATNTTSMILQNLTANQWYVVRVRAETRAGVGEPTNPVDVRIFLNPKPTGTPQQHHPPPNHDTMQDAPSSNTSFFSPANKQYLGVILGAVLGVCCIIICATIIVFRNRCFPFFSRSPRHPPNYVNGNGHGPFRWKRSLESLNGVEMKALQSLTTQPNDDHIDTKGGHPTSNGLIPGPNQDGVSDPLLMRIVRNPIEQRQHELELDVQIRGNCIR